ncbi:MAG: hypothetical protein IPH48_12730 [bacterium]|nr:hypothetical protein [bacterium]
MYRRLASAIVVTFLASAAMPSTWSVQRDGTGDFTTIQPALDAAADGDTILIGPGEYTESTTIRPPGWAYDIQSYADLRCDDLTIIGAGMDATVIGPATYLANADGDPAGLSYGGGGTLYISDVGIRHSYAMYVIGCLYMERCHFTNNKRGLSWNPSGPGGWVRDSVFEVTEPIFDPESFEIGYGGLGSGIVLERCHFGVVSVIRSVQGLEMRDCSFHGLGVYASTIATIIRSTSVGSNVAISQSQGGSVCTVVDCDLAGETAAIAVSSDALGGRFVVENSRLAGGTSAAVYLGRFAGSCEVRGCDLIKGAGPVVRCEPNGPAVTHDLRNNFWGTTDATMIRSWIVGASSCPNTGATVLYAPFAGQSVPTESTSWGDLKAIFR